MKNKLSILVVFLLSYLNLFSQRFSEGNCFEGFNTIRINFYSSHGSLVPDIFISYFPANKDSMDFKKLPLYKFGYSLHMPKYYFIDSSNFWTIFNFLKGNKYPYTNTHNVYLNEDKEIQYNLVNYFSAEVQLCANNQQFEKEKFIFKGWHKQLDFFEQIILCYQYNKLKKDTVYQMFSQIVQGTRHSTIKYFIQDFVKKFKSSDFLYDTNYIHKDYIKNIQSKIDDSNLALINSKFDDIFLSYQDYDFRINEEGLLDDYGDSYPGYYKHVVISRKGSTTELTLKLVNDNGKLKIIFIY